MKSEIYAQNNGDTRNEYLRFNSQLVALDRIHESRDVLDPTCIVGQSVYLLVSLVHATGILSVHNVGCKVIVQSLKQFFHRHVISDI